MSPYDWPETRFRPPGVPQRIFDKCNAKMELLADLRESGAYPAKRIYRCYTCNNVVAELR
jgi:hypothetical protein